MEEQKQYYWSGVHGQAGKEAEQWPSQKRCDRGTMLAAQLFSAPSLLPPFLSPAGGGERDSNSED